ncbi:porin [Neopusillimonas maritima]|jgi:predicted porin|uniref:Porin n=1 Tax=Neopusillimonas maritima TaxID=2026239 RepID=A0ABX9MYV2_9BURK|nr:porin [Neopusillimonas maritima]MBF23441.1 porin [Pusillimonas sp.]RII84165.1 porin [Neopusillimonas maritima]HCN73222.1 porin [Pusillimonas sp.]|tara:strand:- start:140596 stop:141792 length:1197 start_codon:yes stop_codon:yes gene_type:complete
MKKNLLTAALIAGFAAGAVQAETSVTLYGRVDGGFGYQQFKGTDAAGADVKGTNTGMVSGINSGNRWGLKGTEDLGEGLKAVFQLESGFDLGTGESGQGGRLFGRQATVGLMSDSWGRLDFGRQTNIASKYFAGVASPFGTSFGQARVGSAFSAARNHRLDNMIMYQTPNFSGFQFGLGYSFNASGNQEFKQSGGAEPNVRSWTTGLRYSNGPLAAALVYDQFKNKSTGNFTAADDGVTVKSWNLALSYDFEVVKVHAAGGQTRNGWFSANSSLGSNSYLGNFSGNIPDPSSSNPAKTSLELNSFAVNDNLKVNSYALGLSAPVGSAGKLMASWMMSDPSNAGIYNWGEDKQNVYSVGYSYKLSKRTNIYALGSYADNVNFQDDLKATQFAVGLRHQF